MTKTLSGVLVPVTTPFHPSTGHIDYEAVRSNAQSFLNQGATGLLVAGSTGEAPLLTDDEATALVRELRNLIPDDRWLIVGAGRESTTATVAACKSAFDAGADAVLIRAPSYFASAMTEATLSEHFKTIADESPAPVLLYNMPKYTHVNFTPELISTLASHQNIIGAKDSSGNLDNFKLYREAASNWSMLVGSAGVLLGALELGAVGGILAVGNFAFELAKGVHTEFTNGNAETAAARQEVLGTLHREIVAAHGPAGVKCAMDFVNLTGGHVRSPLADLQQNDTERIRELLAELLPG